MELAEIFCPLWFKRSFIYDAVLSAEQHFSHIGAPGVFLQPRDGGNERPPGFPKQPALATAEVYRVGRAAHCDQRPCRVGVGVQGVHLRRTIGDRQLELLKLAGANAETNNLAGRTAHIDAAMTANQMGDGTDAWRRGPLRPLQ